MRYVVTGAAGFIGHHVGAALLQDGHAVDGVDGFTDYYDPDAKRANAARLASHRYLGVELDLAAADIDDVLAGADAVIRLAAQPGVGPSWAGGFSRTSSATSSPPNGCSRPPGAHGWRG